MNSYMRNQKIKAEPDSWAKVQEGKLVIENKIFALPNLQLGRELGRGANAVVFEAFDMMLRRQVAVKIWNSRGKQRAQAETSKIAQMHHPLIVATHVMQWVQDHPYSVMELVAGESGKKWLTSNPSIEDRIRVWQLYSRALRYVHSQGAVHGDPHVGNILVYRDTTGHFHNSFSETVAPIGIKVADAGTSEFLSSRSRLLEREAELILETAKRLFHDQNFDNLWSHPPNLNYGQTLNVLDAFVDFINFTVKFPYFDHAAENAEKLVEIVLKVPLFNLDGVLANIKSGSQTTVSRFVRRLRRDLLNLRDWLDWDEGLAQEVKDKYAIVRSAYLNNLESTL